MSSKIRSMRRAMQKAGQKAVARQVHVFSGLYDEIKRVCESINTAMIASHDEHLEKLTPEEREKQDKPDFRFIDPSTFIHTILANGVNQYWAEQKALEDATKKAQGGIIQVVGGEVAQKIRAEGKKLEERQK